MKKLVLIALLSLSATSHAEMLGQPQVQTPEVVTVPEGTTIPMLEVTYECGECKPDSKMKALIQGSYIDQAELEKAAIDYTKTVSYKISKFNSRGKARFFLGALAGRDHILGSLECNGKQVEVADTAISAVNGIESVAQNVGKDAYRVMVNCVLNKEGETK